MTPMLKWVGAGLTILAVVVVLGGVWVWHDRPELSASGIPVADPGAAPDGVTVTWMGVTTLLFDDGDTRLMIDGFFSRPGPLELIGDIAPDEVAVERALTSVGVDRLAAVMTVHSHYDHAMDVAVVAERTGARVLGSRSTANVARGGGIPDDRITVVEDTEKYRFGRFTVTFFVSRHIPQPDTDEPPMPGTIDTPLTPPAPVTAWREGGSYSILIEHPAGDALVQGSAGFIPGKLDDVSADAVFLGVGLLSGHDRAYAREYWHEIVETTGAQRVYPVHYDDFTRPYGDVRPFPRLVDDVGETLGRLRAFAAAGDRRLTLSRLPLAQPVPLFDR